MSSQKNRASGKPRGDAGLARVAGAQNGIASLAQTEDSLGLTRRSVARRAQGGRLHRVHRGVYAVGHLAVGRAGALRAALLACGEGAVLSHGTAAALWGLRDRWPVLIDVTGGRQAGRKIEGIRCRRCRYPTPEEIGVRNGLAVTTPARTLVDLAGMLGTDSLRRAVERAAVLKQLDLRELDRAMLSARGRRGVRAVGAILEPWRTDDGAVPDVRSDFEALVLPRLLELGLPRPACNRTLLVGGERLMVDFLWEQQRLVVETDGRETHATPVAFQRDRRRDQVLVAAGYRVGRVTWDQMQGELDAVVARIGRALRGEDYSAAGPSSSATGDSSALPRLR